LRHSGEAGIIAAGKWVARYFEMIGAAVTTGSGRRPLQEDILDDWCGGYNRQRISLEGR